MYCCFLNKHYSRNCYNKRRRYARRPPKTRFSHHSARLQSQTNGAALMVPDAACDLADRVSVFRVSKEEMSKGPRALCTPSQGSGVPLQVGQISVPGGIPCVAC